MTKRYILAIDPDVEASGFAVLDCEERRFVRAESRTFPEVVDWMSFMQPDYAADVLVVMEDSELGGNWHLNPRDSKTVAAAKGRSVGLCHATARHLKEMAESMGYEVMGVRPLRKVWRGKDGKITHEEAAQFMTGMPSRTNQDVRDAMLLAWAHAGFPIRLRPR